MADGGLALLWRGNAKKGLNDGGKSGIFGTIG